MSLSCQEPSLALPCRVDEVHTAGVGMQKPSHTDPGVTSPVRRLWTAAVSYPPSHNFINGLGFLAPRGLCTGHPSAGDDTLPSPPQPHLYVFSVENGFLFFQTPSKVPFSMTPRWPPRWDQTTCPLILQSSTLCSKQINTLTNLCSETKIIPVDYETCRHSAFTIALT